MHRDAKLKRAAKETDFCANSLATCPANRTLESTPNLVFMATFSL
jgi:hypothetical protein